MGDNVSDDDGPGRIPQIVHSPSAYLPVLLSSDNVGLVSRQRAEGEMNKDIGRHDEENACPTPTTRRPPRGPLDNMASSNVGGSTRKKAQENFTPLLQLDVFHALWERYHWNRTPGSTTRSANQWGRGKRFPGKKRLTHMHPIGTKLRREFADIRGRRKVFVAEAYDFRDPYWRVRYPDHNWEQLNRQEGWGGGWRQL